MLILGFLGHFIKLIFFHFYHLIIDFCGNDIRAFFFTSLSFL
jgi:hypothetical protein